jgi:hypothetical protein
MGLAMAPCPSTVSKVSRFSSARSARAIPSERAPACAIQGFFCRDCIFYIPQQQYFNSTPSCCWAE